MSATESRGLPKYLVAAARIRRQIAAGTLGPGMAAPSSAALSRATGYSTETCSKALRALVKDGVLQAGHGRRSRLRVADPRRTPAEQKADEAARALSAELAARRRAAGLTQLEFAGLVKVCITTVGHAETGRLWQSSPFWNAADAALAAGGELLRLYAAYRDAVPGQVMPGRENVDVAAVAAVPMALASQLIPPSPGLGWPL